MTEITRSATVTISNPQGLHMRPAYLFAELAARYHSRIEVIKDDIRIDGKSVLSILTLGAAQGTEVALEVTGPDASDALAALVDLVASGFLGDAEPVSSSTGAPTTGASGNVATSKNGPAGLNHPASNRPDQNAPAVTPPSIRSPLEHGPTEHGS